MEKKANVCVRKDTGYTLKADANTDTDGKHRRATVGDNRRVESCLPGY